MATVAGEIRPSILTALFISMIADLNRHVVKTSKSLDVLFDNRDEVSIATRLSLDKVLSLRS